MTTLNKKAAEVITANTREQRGRRAFAIHAMTDVTGFGLIGHAREMALASNVSLRFFASRIPLLAGALECVRAGHIPGGLNANRDFAECIVSYDDAVPDDIRPFSSIPRPRADFSSRWPVPMRRACSKPSIKQAFLL